MKKGWESLLEVAQESLASGHCVPSAQRVPVLYKRVGTEENEARAQLPAPCPQPCASPADPALALHLCFSLLVFGPRTAQGLFPTLLSPHRPGPMPGSEPVLSPGQPPGPHTQAPADLPGPHAQPPANMPDPFSPVRSRAQVLWVGPTIRCLGTMGPPWLCSGATRCWVKLLGPPLHPLSEEHCWSVAIRVLVLLTPNVPQGEAWVAPV